MGKKTTTKKNYVLDTNILIHNPDCLNKFDEHDVYIPHPVIEELDGLKDSPGETGYAAREASRKIKELVSDIISNIDKKTPGGGEVIIYYGDYTEEWIKHNLPSGWKTNKMDNLILLTVKDLNDTLGNAILVTNDTNMQLKATLMHLQVQEYKNDRVAEGVEIYTGRSVRHISNNGFNSFVKDRKVSPSELQDEGQKPLTINEFVTLKTWEGNSMLAKYDGCNLVALEFDKKEPCDLVTRNSGQIYLKEALMSSYAEHPLTLCVGPAGTGKTLFAMGCGLEQVDDKMYKRVLLCRPNIMMDEEIGFLPGTEQDKISPLLRGAYDNLEVLIGNKEDTKEIMQDKITELFQRGIITAQSLAYLRGRSITSTYIIIDEAQNCSPNQILSIITRAGEGSKIVILGDPNQIDNPRLDKRNNGLVFAIERMKGSKLCEVMTFDESECTRSPLAKEASDKLRKNYEKH